MSTKIKRSSGARKSQPTTLDMLLDCMTKRLDVSAWSVEDGCSITLQARGSGPGRAAYFISNWRYQTVKDFADAEAAATSFVTTVGVARARKVAGELLARYETLTILEAA